MVRTPGPGLMTFDEGWEIIEAGISKLKQILEGKLEIQFDSEDYLLLYETIYNMCTQDPRNDYSAQLYERYKGVITDYISSTVLSCLRETHDEFLLMEFVKRWANHKVMVRWLTRFFHYLNRYHVPRCNKAPLQEVGRLCFVELVYEEMKGRVTNAVIRLIDREREGEQIDRSLLKNVLDVFVDIGVGTDSTRMDFYVNDFEDAMLKDTADYYSRKASIWIVDQVSCPEYMLKAEECLKQEKERAAHYLHSSTEQKLLELVRKQFHSAREN